MNHVKLLKFIVWLCFRLLTWLLIDVAGFKSKILSSKIFGLQVPFDTYPWFRTSRPRKTNQVVHHFGLLWLSINHGLNATCTFFYMWNIHIIFLFYWKFILNILTKYSIEYFIFISFGPKITKIQTTMIKFNEIKFQWQNSTPTCNTVANFNFITLI